MFWSRYPYTDMSNLNLDWVIEILRAMEKKLDDFVATNSIKYANPFQWSIINQYEKNTLVIEPNTGTAYLSVKAVPQGVNISNTDYWTPVFELTTLFSVINENFTSKNEAINVYSDHNYNVGDWLIWHNVLQEVTSPINQGDPLAEGVNIERITVEGVIKTINTALDTLSLNVNNSIAEINDKLDNLKVFATPEMFGNGDTQSFVDMFNSGADIFILEGSYTIDNIEISLNNATITGHGLLDFSATKGGLKITGDNNDISINAKGAIYPSGDVTATKSLLHIVGSGNKIHDSLFEGGNLSGIQLSGSKNMITNCTFNKCNSHPTAGADWGSIWLTNDSDSAAPMFEDNIISDNIINDFDYSGICVIGKYKNTVIKGNHLKSTNATDTMGIYMFAGCLEGAYIHLNHIEKIFNEGIVLTDSVADYVAERVTVTENTLIDCKERGIVYAGYNGGIIGGSVIISNNNVKGSRFGINCDKITRFIASGNVIESSAEHDSNIYAIDSINECLVTNNILIGNGSGIMIGCTGSISGNLIKSAVFGINLFGADQFAVTITSNAFISCTYGITGYTTTAPADSLFTANTFKDCTNIARNAISILGYEKNVAVPSAFSGTLSAGTATITVYDGRTGDGWLAVPVGGTGGGSLNCNYDNSTKQVTVTSTSNTDNRNIIIVKMING